MEARLKSSKRPPKALYILNGGLGDVIMALPALDALYRQTGLLIDPVIQNAAACKVLERIEYVGEVFVCPLWSVRKALSVVHLAWTLRRRRYVLGVFGHGNARPKTRFLMSVAAPRKIVPSRPVDWANNGCVHKVDLAFQNLTELGISSNLGRVKPIFPLRESDRSRAASIWRQWGLHPNASAVGLINGGGPNGYSASKKWSADRWLQLSRELVASRICPIYFAGPDEIEQGYYLRQQLGGTLLVADHMDICLYAALLERCSAAICNDTGLMHIAWAVGTPVVGLYGPTLPQLTGAYGEGNVALRVCNCSGGCYRGGQRLISGCDAAACMAGINVPEVISAVLSLLSRSLTQ